MSESTFENIPSEGVFTGYVEQQLMAINGRPAKQYQCVPSIDLAAAFSRVDVEYLTVTDRRAITIYTQSILNIDVKEGDLENTHTLEVEVLDHHSRKRDTDPVDLIEMLIHQISNNMGSDVQEV